MPKRQFCLGSITKCHVIRTGGGFQGGAKETPQKQYVICLANYLYYAFGAVAWCFVFGSWGRLQTTPSGFARVDGICDASLASRDCTLSTGGAQES